MTFDTNAQIFPSDTVYVVLKGINNPPTVSTPGTYKVTTTDGQFIVDETSSTSTCIIDPVA